MRRFALIAMSLAVAAGIVAPASGEPNVRRYEEAFADWLLPTATKNEFKWLGAYAVRGTNVAGTGHPISYAGFVEGDCIRRKKPDYISITCGSTRSIFADPEKDFEMTPLATEARLSVRRRGRTHVARWDLAEAGGAYVMSEYCFTVGPGEEEQEGEGHGAGIWNPAEARGRFFGHRFRDPTRARWSGLLSGAMVTTCSFRTVDYDPGSGSLHVQYRIPR